MDVDSNLIDPETGLIVTPGLDGQDDNIDRLSHLFYDLQPYSAEILMSGVQDVVSFVFHDDTVYFGVLSVLKQQETKATSSNGEPKPDPRSVGWWRENVARQRSTQKSAATQNEDTPSTSENQSSSVITPTLHETQPLSIKRRKHNIDQTIHSSNSHTDSTSGLEELDCADRPYVDAWDLACEKADEQAFRKPFLPAGSWEEERAYPAAEDKSDWEPVDVSQRYMKNHAREGELDQARQSELVGFIYLAVNNQRAPGITHKAELNIGIVLDPEYRKKGYAQRAVEFMLKYAFDDLKVHRVQAVLVDKESPYRDSMMMLLTQQRFTYEGARRLALCSPLDQKWKDVEYLSILDTGYLMRSFFTPAPRSLWEELLARHQREREELLRWEDNQNGTSTKPTAKLRRVSSTGTLVGAPSELESSRPDDPFKTASEVTSPSPRSSATPPLSSPPRSQRSDWDMVSEDGDPFRSHAPSSLSGNESDGAVFSSSDSWSLAGSSDLND